MTKIAATEDRYGKGRPCDGPQIADETPPKPEWGYIAGYFYDWDADRKDCDRIPRGVVRDLDFVRLKDEFLFMVDPRPGLRFLDIGCAVGATAIYCALQGAEVVGIDLSPSRVETANANFAKLRLSARAQVADATKLPFPDNHFDLVTSVDFLEHVDESTKRSVLKECYRVLKPAGRMIHRTPNLSYLKLSLAFKRLRAIARLKNPFNVVIAHTTGPDPEHIGLINRKAMERILLDCKIVSFEFSYPPLRRKGLPRLVGVMSSEIPLLRDLLANDVLVTCRKSVILSHFP
jgi:2-polyprenyl-3-methyl-5-hydroxy-6-metoxy-1,4-benzoquinol methylase